jgi:hypothetical protein
LGVHGIDAWCNVMKGREELRRVAVVTGEKKVGIRMHWLLRDENTFRVLEESGYDYDSTIGFNETPGYRSGTTQAFRPLGSGTLMELPMHIQDGALFYPKRLGLTDATAWKMCEGLIENATKLGGVLTLLWHDRSHGPERFWGEFYARLVAHLRMLDVWFASGAQAVGWFRRRREVCFESVDGGSTVGLRNVGGITEPAMTVRIHRPKSSGGLQQENIAWTGETDFRVCIDGVLEEATTQ